MKPEAACKYGMVTHDSLRSYSFSTDRLVVDEWNDLAARLGLDLIEVVASVLTATTTAALPSQWSGDFDHERAERWVESRDTESPTLLAVEHATGRAIGLLILFEAAGEDAFCEVDLRLGYVLAEAAWGRGFASELVSGLVAWARFTPSIQTISAGIAPTNAPSERVLLKNGFLSSGGSDGEQMYQISLDTSGA